MFLLGLVPNSISILLFIKIVFTTLSRQFSTCIPVGTGTCSTWVSNIVQHLEVRNCRRSPLHFSQSPFSLFMSQHYSNAFIEKTMSPNTSNLALPFSDYLQRERWREPELIRSVCPRNISVPYCEVFRDSRVSAVSDHRTL